MKIGSTDIVLIRGDVTKQDVDAVVNAANADLLPGGGVCGAIYAAGGPRILKATEAIRSVHGGCPTGEAVCTTGGDLPARFVIHAVGPIWQGGGSGEAALLASCHRLSLEIATSAGARSIAFPAISTGIYGYPLDLAAPIALGTAREFALEQSALDEIRFVLFDEKSHLAFSKAWEALGAQE
jgi:O-acetyl-ADP-ribose deacetylase (regulator of RNase III)